MMEAMGSYILSVAAAAAILGIVSCVVDAKSSAGAFVKLIGGLYLVIVVLQPLVNFDLNALNSFWSDFALEGETVSAQGKELAGEAVADIIKHETEAYILDKAGLYGAELQVEVELSEKEPAVPVSVTIWGRVDSDAKRQLKAMIESELGIPKEDQVWIGRP